MLLAACLQLGQVDSFAAVKCYPHQARGHFVGVTDRSDNVAAAALLCKTNARKLRRLATEPQPSLGGFAGWVVLDPALETAHTVWSSLALNVQPGTVDSHAGIWGHSDTARVDLCWGGR